MTGYTVDRHDASGRPGHRFAAASLELELELVATLPDALTPARRGAIAFAPPRRRTPALDVRDAARPGVVLLESLSASRGPRKLG